LNLFAGFQHCDLAGLHVHDAFAVFVFLLRRIERFVRRRRRDEERVHGRDLLAVEFRIVVLVEKKQLHDGGSQTRDAAQLASIRRIHQMHDIQGWNAHRFACQVWLRQVAGMAAQEMIRHAPPVAVELDAAPDDIAVRKNLVLGQRQHFGRQKLQLKRHRQAKRRGNRPKDEKRLARDKHLPRGAALQTIKVSQPFRVGVIRPVAPQFHDALFEPRIGYLARRVDTVAHGVACPTFRCVCGIAVVPNEITCPRRDRRPCADKQRVQVQARWLKRP